MKKIIGLLLLLICQMPVLRAQYFRNPILAGYYPDPSICKAGDDYYLVNSSFAYFPGLPLFHSKDLVNWEQIGYAMNRPSQLDLTGAPVAYGGLYAPTIRYHNGLFYIVCTQVGPKGNFVITAKDAKGPWSEPVYLPEVNGIDPSLFFDDNDYCWLVHNSSAPNNKPLYDGHSTIRMFAFDYKNLKVTGASRILVNGGTDITKKPRWIEGPHLYKKDGWYYLMCAEGGTEEGHTEVVFRARNITDSFMAYPQNPILTQRHLLHTLRKNPVTSTGHADLVQDKNGKWWGVFLGCRPYAGDYYNTGRETFMAPVVWKNGWPVFDLGGDEVQYRYPMAADIHSQFIPLNGNYIFRDEFDANTVNLRYQFLRTPLRNWYSLAEKHGTLAMQLQPETCSGMGNPSMVAFHQPHLKGSASTSFNFTALAENEQAGLLLFQNENAYYFLCKTKKAGKDVLQLLKRDSVMAEQEISANASKQIDLKVEANGEVYSFFYATQKGNWIPLLMNVDAKYLSTKNAGGFVGAMYAMYATSNGKPTTNKAFFDWFEITNNDDVYRELK